jgi:hypothetical protein
MFGCAHMGGCSMNTATYDIFRKELDNTTLLIESVKGIDEARRRVSELSEEDACEYFIFDPVKARVVEPADPKVTKDPFKL